MSHQTGPQHYNPPPPSDGGTRPSLLPFLADHHLPYLVPAVFFWVISLIFHYIDTRGHLSAYKLHTPAEHLTKNRASKRDVIKFALLQQAAQCLLGYSMADDTEHFVPHDHAIAAWVQTIRHSEAMASQWIRYLGFGLTAIPSNWKGYGPASAVSFTPSHVGNFSYDFTAQSAVDFTPSSPLELMTAKAIYWILVPLFQYILAMVLADTFQYFTHRAFHVNKWLYKHIHYMHHDIYVPFAYGAFYNHPLETIPIDGIGFPACLAMARLDNRQSAFFGAIWTFKTVVDHCGYDFPYNPCNIVCPHSVLYHDLHHQTWGMKYNFSVYGSFWDWLMGTRWSPHDSKALEKYKRGKANAEISAAKAKPEYVASTVAIGSSSAVDT